MPVPRDRRDSFFRKELVQPAITVFSAVNPFTLPSLLVGWSAAAEVVAYIMLWSLLHVLLRCRSLFVPVLPAIGRPVARNENGITVCDDGLNACTERIFPFIAIAANMATTGSNTGSRRLWNMNITDIFILIQVALSMMLARRKGCDERKRKASNVTSGLDWRGRSGWRLCGQESNNPNPDSIRFTARERYVEALMKSAIFNRSVGIPTT